MAVALSDGRIKQCTVLWACLAYPSKAGAATNSFLFIKTNEKKNKTNQERNAFYIYLYKASRFMDEAFFTK